MVPYTITHQGVPIGNVELDPAQTRSAAAVAPLPAYDAIRPIVLAASLALRAAAVSTGDADVVSRSALDRGAALGKDLELRDARGELVPTDFIELAEWPGEDPEVRAWVGIRGVAAGRPAAPAPRTTQGSESASPAA